MTLSTAPYDFGPPLTDQERAQFLRERLARPRMAYSQETREKIRRLAAMGATFREILDRTDLHDLSCLRGFTRRHRLGPVKRGKCGSGNTKPPIVRQIVTGMLTKPDCGYHEIWMATRRHFDKIENLRSWMFRHGFRNRVKGERYSNKHDQRMILGIWRMVRAGHDGKEIQAAFSLTRGQVYGLIWGYDLRNVHTQPERFIRVFGSYKYEHRAARRSPTSTAVAG